MGNKRQAEISKSIHRALLKDPDRVKKGNIIAGLLAFFAIWKIRLMPIAAALFQRLRNDVWKIDENEYRNSFRYEKGESRIEPMGDLGYSGSTFFRTTNSKFLIKSLPRHSEHSFFKEDFLRPYHEHMRNHPDSLLIRITDFLGSRYLALGTIFRVTPSHHVIMENVLCDRQKGRAEDKWETYDLKPVDFFYPERDLVPDQLTGEGTMRKLFDTFDDKMRLTKDQYEDLKRTIEDDTAFLQSVNAIDYSLFLVRYPAHLQPGNTTERTSQWREGVPSTDGKWKYRAVLLDFFWAKHKLQAQAMTGVVQTFNVVGRQGPMSITTTAEEYRRKFLEMIDEMVELRGST